VVAVRAVLDSWDAFELWLTQLAFPLQVLLALVVLLPLCWGTAAGVDRLVDRVLDRRSVSRRAR
jgi:elongation factor P--beta-lysine ligase